MEGEEELSVNCLMVVVKGKGTERIVRGVVYIMRSREPRNEPWETTQDDVHEDAFTVYAKFRVLHQFDSLHNLQRIVLRTDRPVTADRQVT